MKLALKFLSLSWCYCSSNWVEMRSVVFKCLWNKVFGHCRPLFTSFHSIALLRLWYMIWLKFYNSLIWKMVFDGRQLWMEDNLQLKTTFNWRWSFMKDNLWWKTIYHGWWPEMENECWWKATFDGRWLLMEDGLQLKIVYLGLILARWLISLWGIWHLYTL